MSTGSGENCRPNSVFGLRVDSSYLRADVLAVASCMRTLFTMCAAGFFGTAIFIGSALGGKPIDQSSNERTVFVTGSLIPQRIKLKQIGTTTISPIRIIDRQEIDATGRQTTKGALVTDPSVRIVGH